MRASRLLSIVLLLQAHHGLTAHDLAERLEVSERTILRDMDALGEVGIPVVAERGRGGGWYLLEGYRTSLTGLHLDEIHALMLATPTRVLSDLGLEDAAAQAVLKVLAALPALHRADAVRMRERIHIDGTRWYDSPESVARLPILQDAIWQECRIRIQYTRSAGETVARVLEPLGLVAKGQTWYLVASVDGDVRTYRVARIEQVQITEEHFLRPQQFNLAEYWEQSTRSFLAQLPRYPAVVHIHQDALSVVQWWRWATVQSSAATDRPDWYVVEVQFETLADATACILGCGGQALVISPDELRDTVRQKIAALCRCCPADEPPPA
ncbi:MAG: YafY family transcriptional regulator [Chloroflexaceae bacterium]|nr:YafY family transcriptional regulator [Chloroflexaceae bacterium]